MDDYFGGVMPILDVEVVLKPEESLREGLAGKIADAAGEIFGSALGETWVKLRSLSQEQYAENAGAPPEGVWPVFVNVLKREWLADEAMRAEAGALVAEIGRICKRPRENVHILYQPPGAGRIFFGGA